MFGVQNVNAHGVGHVLCCMCGMGMPPNPAGMCVDCIRSQVGTSLFTRGHQPQLLLSSEIWFFVVEWRVEWSGAEDGERDAATVSPFSRDVSLDSALTVPEEGGAEEGEQGRTRRGEKILHSTAALLLLRDFSR